MAQIWPENPKSGLRSAEERRSLLSSLLLSSSSLSLSLPSIKERDLVIRGRSPSSRPLFVCTNIYAHYSDFRVFSLGYTWVSRLTWIMSVVIYHMYTISYLNAQKWVQGPNNNVLRVKIIEKMVISEEKWVPWPIWSTGLMKLFLISNTSCMSMMELLANSRVIFTTKLIGRLWA